MNRTAVFAVAIAGAALALPADTVPAGLVPFSDRAPLEFVTLLATAHVPSGIELREADDKYGLGELEEVEPTVHFDEDTRVPAPELVDGFNENHCCYHAEWRDGVFVIRPVDGAVGFLDETSSMKETTTVTGAMNAARAVMCQLDPSLCSGAIAGSFLGDPRTAGEYDVITLDPRRRPTVLEVLNQIVRQSPRAWNVVTRNELDGWKIVRYGIISAHGQRTIGHLKP